jgi:hypothetical protein
MSLPSVTRRTALAGVAATTVLGSRLVRPWRQPETAEPVLASAPGTDFFARQASGTGTNTTSVALVNSSTGSVMSGVNAVSLFAQRSGPDLVDSVVATDGRTTVRTVTSFISGTSGDTTRLPGAELRLGQATEVYGIVEQSLGPDGQYVALYCESPQLTSTRGTKATPVPITGVVRSCVSVYAVARRQLVATFTLPVDQTFTAGTGGCLSWDPSGRTLQLFVTRRVKDVVSAATYTLEFAPAAGSLTATKILQRSDPGIPLSAPQSSQATFTSDDLNTVVAVRGNVLYAYDTSTGAVVSSTDISTMPIARGRPLAVDVLATPDHRYVLTFDKATGAVSVYDSSHRRFTHRSNLSVMTAPRFRSLALIPGSAAAVVADPGPTGGALVVSLPEFKVIDHLAKGVRVSSVTTVANRIVLKHAQDAAVSIYPSMGGGGATISVPSTLTSVL